jgi:hypothetical protein
MNMMMMMMMKTLPVGVKMFYADGQANRLRDMTKLMMYYDSLLYDVHYASIVCTMYLLFVLCIYCLCLTPDYFLLRCRTAG